MKISQQGIDMIKGFEGLRLDAYDDGTGVWTIGWGSTGMVNSGDRITIEQAEKLLAIDIEQADNKASKFVDMDAWALRPNLIQARFDALVSFCMNIGGVKTGSKLWRRLMYGPLDAVPAVLMEYINAGGKPMEGLRKRRNAEAHLWETGQYPAPQPPAPRPVLRRGSSGPAVEELQRGLARLGYVLDIDGDFGDDTEAAVYDFQRTHPALKLDSVVGDKTWSGLDAALAEQKGGAR